MTSTQENTLALPGDAGIILVDHGSRRDESNQLLLDAVEAYRGRSTDCVVEPAHMELAEPSIAAAFRRCVEQGVKSVIIFPYFLSPGRHWHDDIPALAAKAAEPFPGVPYLVTAPFGVHPLMLDVIDARIRHCLQRAAGEAEPCDVCTPEGGCRMHANAANFSD